MSTPIRIYLDLPPRYTKRGPHYTARLDGEIIVSSSMTPLLDAARVLLSRGIIGRIEMWDHERPYPRMVGEIAKLAKLTVADDGRTGTPYLVKRSARHGSATKGGDSEAEP